MVNGNKLSDSTINAAQTLLKYQYPLISGLQNTLLGQKMKFNPILVQSGKDCVVQILHTGRCCNYMNENFIFYLKL